MGRTDRCVIQNFDDSHFIRGKFYTPLTYLLLNAMLHFMWFTVFHQMVPWTAPLIHILGSNLDSEMEYWHVLWFSSAPPEKCLYTTSNQTLVMSLHMHPFKFITHSSYSHSMLQTLRNWQHSWINHKYMNHILTSLKTFGLTNATKTSASRHNHKFFHPARTIKH